MKITTDKIIMACYLGWAAIFLITCSAVITGFLAAFGYKTCRSLGQCLIDLLT